MGRPDFAPHLQTSHEAGRNLGVLQNKNITDHEGLLEEDSHAGADGEKYKQNLDDYDVGRSSWRCPNYAGSSFHLGVENDCMVEKSVLLGV